MFKETYEKVIASINKLITTDTKDEDIEAINNLKSDVDELKQEFEKTSESYGKMKDKYIESITKMGNSQKVDDLEKRPKTLEEIQAEIIAHRNK